MGETVLITGASSGIGHELARQFASKNFNLVLVSRNKDKLVHVQKELEDGFGVTVRVLAKDLSLANAPEELFADLDRESIKIDVLVNNAGFGSYGDFADSDMTNVLEMIHLNITALTHLTKLALPAMIQRGRGKILNVASTAAFQPGPLMAVYYATKAYVLSFSEAIANELSEQGITVTALCPGPTDTGFKQRAKLEQSNLFNGPVMDAKSVAELGLQGLLHNKPVIIPGLRNKVLSFSIRFLPRGMVTKIVRKLQDKRS